MKMLKKSSPQCYQILSVEFSGSILGRAAEMNH